MAREIVKTSSAEPSRLTRADAIGIALLFALFLTLSYIRSRHRMFWGDEIMGLLVLKQPTWHDQLRLWRTGFDSSGLWFHVFGRLWIAIFGASEIALRQFSALALAASAAVLWIAARRYYNLLPVAAAICFVYFGMRDVVWQLANGRSYGLFLLGTACVLYVLLRGEDPSTNRPSALFLLGTLAAYGLLIGSHTLGLLYAAVFLGVQLVLDLHARRIRPLLYLSIAASFAVAAFSRSNILGTMATGKPSYWTHRPSPSMLFSPNTVFSGKYVGAMAALLFVVVLLTNRHLAKKRVPVYFILLGCAGVNVIFYVCSLQTTSIYVDRYLMPLALGGALLLCELLTMIHEATAPLPRVRAALPVLLLVLAACFLSMPRFQRRHWFPFPDYTPHLLARLPPDLPIVHTNAGSFREMLFYQSADMHRPFLFPVDWEVALDPSNTAGVSGFHEMDRFKEDGFYPGSIQTTAQILAQQHRFVVISSRVSPIWLQKRILADSRYSVQSLGAFQEDGVDLSLWLVHD